MKPSILFAFFLSSILAVWSVVSGNMEFVIYAVTAFVVVGLLYWGDRKNDFANWTIWAFDIWLVMHILGGLLPIGDHVLYSQMLIPLIGEPYNVLKYDQVVHFYCYFVIALLLWQVLANYAGAGASRLVMVVFTVLAAAGVGGLNEIIEFIATVSVPDVNVGGYENTAIDIICNTLGAICAVPFFKRLNN